MDPDPGKNLRLRIHSTDFYGMELDVSEAESLFPFRSNSTVDIKMATLLFFKKFHYK